MISPRTSSSTFRRSSSCVRLSSASSLLKTFNIKPKVVRGQQAECGGAMVGKMPNVIWLEGSFVETIKGWQSAWFYITEPRDAKWATAPEFRSGFPTRLTSWKEKGLSWGFIGGAGWTLEMYLEYGKQEAQACQHSPGYAHPPDPPMSTMGF